jgi:hypothetical protein
MKGNHKHGCTQKAKRSKENPEWRAWSTWQAMLNRCRNPNVNGYENYGGRGISVCERWLEFQPFYSDMGAPPKGASIDRIDNNGNYEPGNCRWATRKEQSTNRRNRREITHAGITMSLTEWARQLGVPRRLLQVRMDRGWNVERMLNPQLLDTRFKKGENG